MSCLEGRRCVEGQQPACFVIAEAMASDAAGLRQRKASATEPATPAESGVASAVTRCSSKKRTLDSSAHEHFGITLVTAPYNLGVGLKYVEKNDAFGAHEFKDGDIITAIDGTVVLDHEDAMSRLDSAKGGKIEIEYTTARDALLLVATHGDKLGVSRRKRFVRLMQATMLFPFNLAYVIMAVSLVVYAFNAGAEGIAAQAAQKFMTDVAIPVFVKTGLLAKKGDEEVSLADAIARP